MIKENNWDKIQFLHSNSDIRQRADLFPIYGIKFIPFIVLVNKQGLIEFTGSPKEIKLEEKIEELFN